MRTMIGEPRVVEAGRGAAWWAEGWRMFTSSVGTWIGIMIIYVVISALISAVPFVGTVGHWLLTPVFIGGVMLGCQALERGEPLRVAHLFDGFQGPHFVPLMIIGAFNMGSRSPSRSSVRRRVCCWARISVAQMARRAWRPVRGAAGAVRAMSRAFGPARVRSCCS